MLTPSVRTWPAKSKSGRPWRSVFTFKTLHQNSRRARFFTSRSSSARRVFTRALMSSWDMPRALRSRSSPVKSVLIILAPVNRSLSLPHNLRLQPSLKNEKASMGTWAAWIFACGQMQNFRTRRFRDTRRTSSVELSRNRSISISAVHVHLSNRITRAGSLERSQGRLTKFSPSSPSVARSA